MFFGTVNQLDNYIMKNILNDPNSRFVVLDFSLISGVDYSGLESFLRIKRHLMANHTHLVLCGLGNLETEIRLVGLLDHDDDDEINSVLLVHIFETLNDALEWSENFLLTTYYSKTKSSVPKTLKSKLHPSILPPQTPRATQVDIAASSVLSGNLLLMKNFL